jgi:hypothetical protein
MALVDFTDSGGARHTKSTQLTLPIATPEQRAYLASLVRYGIVTEVGPVDGAAT